MTTALSKGLTDAPSIQGGVHVLIVCRHYYTRTVVVLDIPARRENVGMKRCTARWRYIMLDTLLLIGLEAR